MPRDNNSEIEQLKLQIAELTNIISGNANAYSVPDPIKQLSEFNGNKKELTIWLDEVDQLYDTFKIKGQNGGPDTMNAYYVQAIKNKIKGEARVTLCANGNPTSIPEIKRVLLQHYGDQRDIATNLNLLFNIRKGDKTHNKFYMEIKELETRIKSNLQLNPLSTIELLEKITITKYLDNIQEPLASIIRTTNPSNLEDAYQYVTLNQNAERRKPVYKQKTFSAPQQTSASSASANKFRKPDAASQRRSFHQRPRIETNNTEEVDLVEDEYVEEEEVEEEAIELVEDDLNFQQVRVKNAKT